MNLRALLAAGLAAWTAQAFASHDGCPAPVNAPMESPASLPQANGPRVGLALGSGSMHGLAHIGVIEELEARGLAVRVVAGTSVGALIGGLWASGMSGNEIANLAHAGSWEDPGRFAGSWQGILSNARLREQLAPLFKGRPIESWPRRFGAVATELSNGHRRILMSGDGALAIQASSAVPVMFAPVIVGGAALADGALVEPVPVEAARAMGAEYVIAVDVAYRPYEEPASGLAGNAFQSMHILINALAERQLRDADFAIKLDLHEQLMKCGENALILAGRDAVRRAWPQIARALRAPEAGR
ncbi:MAG: patatin-like phospholipase family protein [Usitatibacter sp.]